MEPVAATRVCVTGAECTGKTTLARALAEHFGAPCVPEYARDYAQLVGRPLTADDVEPIAGGQIACEDAATAPLVILDTDLVSTVVYARHHYGACPVAIEAAAHERRAGLYLLLDLDVPWQADGVRDSGAGRARLHREFEEMLRAIGANVVEIRGTREERLAAAIAAIQAAR